MSSQPSGNSELSIFLRKASLRLLLFLLLLVGIFMINHGRTYYYGLPEKTQYSKISWIADKLDATKSMENMTVFVGSSVCFYGINDSLLNDLDTGNTSYLNLGVIHHCNDIVDVVVQDMVVDHQFRPAKVLLCFKSDALARDIHNMFPLVANNNQILETASDGNVLLIPAMLKKAAWNTHYFTRRWKYDEGKDSLVFRSSHGFQPQMTVDSSFVEVKYKAQRQGMEAVFAFMENEISQPQRSLKGNLLALRRDYIENEKFQSRVFENTAKLLDEHNIPYDIVIYPNLVASRAGKHHVMEEYMKKVVPGIDYTKHHVIVAEGAKFSDARAYVDMNHLSPFGANEFTKFVYDQLRVLDSSDKQP